MQLKESSTKSWGSHERSFWSSSVQFICSVMSDSLRLHGLQHARLPCPSPTPQSFLKFMSIESVMPSNHLILCVPFSSCPQSFPAPGSSPMSQLFFFFFFFPMSQIFAGPVSPFSTRSEERSLVSQGPCCLQSWLEAVPGKCALNAHILTDRFQSTDTKP